MKMGLVRNNSDMTRGNNILNGLEIVFDDDDKQAQKEEYDKILGIYQKKNDKNE